uniref:Uncharacterized protein n=1 Tax=Ciona intestinalis TaxID=7719 RepID=H2XNC2_CIOIN
MISSPKSLIAIFLMLTTSNLSLICTANIIIGK